MDTTASPSSDLPSLSHARQGAAARPGRLIDGAAAGRSFLGALAVLVLIAGPVRAQTTTLIDKSLTVPVFMQTINFQATASCGTQFIVGAGIFNPAVQGIGILIGPSYFQVFALTNGTTGVDVFNQFTLQPGAYSFLYTFANANGTSGDQLAFSATITPLTPPPVTTPPTKAPPVQVNLAAAFNTDGIVLDGQTNPTSGLDGGGAAYSATLMQKASLWTSGIFGTFEQTAFNLVIPSATDIPNAILSTGQTIPLPKGSFSTLAYLAASAGVSVNGQTGNFIVTYTDGTSTVATQSISDWTNPYGFPGEAIAAKLGNYDGTGTENFYGLIDLYEYEIALDPTKTVASLTLPNAGGASGDRGISLFAATLTP